MSASRSSSFFPYMYACGRIVHPSTGRSTRSDKCHEYAYSFILMMTTTPHRSSGSCKEQGPWVATPPYLPTLFSVSFPCCFHTTCRLQFKITSRRYQAPASSNSEMKGVSRYDGPKQRLFNDALSSQDEGFVVVLYGAVLRV